ncbi:MAG: urate hydroxylase PuuD [Candidatus Acidiferrales bacterium]
MATILNFAALHLLQQPHFSFPQGGTATEEIVLRWIHLVAGITWIGLLYFFNLVGTPVMKQLDATVRGKVFPALMSRAMQWFRWSALVTILVGLRYFTIILKADAVNAGNPMLLWRWFGEWLAVWLIACTLIFPLQMPWKGVVEQRWLRAVLIAIVVIAASWIALIVNGGPQSSNSHLSISVGGGLGLVMAMNALSVVWPVHRKLIQWTRANAENGTPIPPEADRLRAWAFFSARVAFWLSFPMLFFMGAADHYPFLSSITD